MSKYKVYSPNCMVIAVKYFDNLDDAYEHYDSKVCELLTYSNTTGIEMQLEDENGQVIDHGTVVN